MSAPIHIGVALTTLTELEGYPERNQTLEADTVIRKYSCGYQYVESLWPAMGSASPDFSSHYLIERKYKKIGKGHLAELTLTYRTNDATSILNANAPLPPDEVEYAVSTTERHLSAHPDYSVTWLGTPMTDGITDPYGSPTTTPTKPGIQSYFIPVAVYRKVSYTRTKPTISGSGNVATRNIPSGEAGANKWLKTGYNLRITRGVYQVSEEWSYLPIGTWDTDIYD